MRWILLVKANFEEENKQVVTFSLKSVCWPSGSFLLSVGQGFEETGPEIGVASNAHDSCNKAYGLVVHT
eukprot:scaffold360_cov374-Pavlova_lutheri.AAC.54